MWTGFHDPAVHLALLDAMVKNKVDLPNSPMRSSLFLCLSDEKDPTVCIGHRQGKSIKCPVHRSGKATSKLVEFVKNGRLDCDFQWTSKVLLLKKYTLQSAESDNQRKC